jgi:hypothetical protein
MKRTAALILLLAGFSWLAGCSLSPEEKVAREKNLKQNVEAFIACVVQPDWNGAFRLTDGSIPSADKLQKQITQSWVSGATLTGGQITSLAWINDDNARVRLTWTFQSGSVESFSSEAFVWDWKGNAWKYRGRSLR